MESDSESDASITLIKAPAQDSAAVKLKKPLSEERLQHLASMRVKALAKRAELKELREKELTVAKLAKESELARRKKDADAKMRAAAAAAAEEDRAATPPEAVVARAVKTKPRRRRPRTPEVSSDSASSSSGSSSDSSSGHRKRRSKRKLRDTVAQLEKAMLKLRYKSKYAKQAQPPQQPVFYQAPQQQQQPQQASPVIINTMPPKSETSQAASDALQRQIRQSCVAGLNEPKLF